MADRRVPFMDLPKQHRPLKAEILDLVSRALDNAAFIGGAELAGFEKEFADFVGTRECVGMANGTDALRLALLAMGVKRGDRVVTTPHTFVATTEAISQAGATFEFVDVEPDTGLMDTGKLESYIQSKGAPAVVLPVHLYGQCVDMEALGALSSKYGFKILEDACQAHGASQRGKNAGTFGHAAAFSFYPGKNLGACGEAGSITTNDPEIAKTCRMLRDHGQGEKYYHRLEGYNARLDAIQAGILRIKLRHLAKWNDTRRAHAKIYDRSFAGIDWIRPVVVRDHNISNYHLYVIHVSKREELREHLKARGIDTGLHYPLPLHLQSCYSGRGFKQGDFPVSERMASTLVSLPMDAEISSADVEYVASAVKEFRG